MPISSQLISHRHLLHTLQRIRNLDRAFLAPLRYCVALVRNKIAADEILPPLGSYCRQYAELVAELAQVNLSCGLLSEAERDFTDAIEYQRANSEAEWPNSQADLMLLKGLAVVRFRSADLDSCIEILKSALGLAESLYETFDPEPVVIVSYLKEAFETRERMQQDLKSVVLAGSDTFTNNAEASEKGMRDRTCATPSYGEQQTVRDKRQIEEDIDFDADLRGAASHGYIEEVKLLLSIENIDPNSQDEHGFTALSWASYGGHETVVQLLLGVDQINVNVKDRYHQTPLYVCSKTGNDKIVQMLLERGADVNAQGAYYGNALQVASAAGHDKIVYMLLKSNADVNSQGGCYDNALHAASAKGYNKIVQMLLAHHTDVNAESGNYGNALYAASGEGHDKIVQMLLEHNAEVLAKGELVSALHAASSEGHDRIVQMLLEYNADVNAQYGPYGNAIEAASATGHDETVEILLSSGARLTAQTLFHLFHSKSTTMIPSLASHIQFDMISERDTRLKKTLLHWAAECGLQTVTERCLGLRADVDATDVFGKTALHYAAGNGHVEIVKILVEANADRKILDMHGHTALRCAQQAGQGSSRRSYPTIVAYLRGQRRTISSIYSETISSFRRA